MILTALKILILLFSINNHPNPTGAMFVACTYLDESPNAYKRLLQEEYSQSNIIGWDWEMSIIAIQSVELFYSEICWNGKIETIFDMWNNNPGEVTMLQNGGYISAIKYDVDNLLKRWRK